jgi:hypothetical protein
MDLKLVHHAAFLLESIAPQIPEFCGATTVDTLDSDHYMHEKR